MLGYIYKELKINKMVLAIMFGLMALFNFFAIPLSLTDDNLKGNGMMFYVIIPIFSGMSFFIVGMVASGLLEADERKKWGYYTACAPNGIRNQVCSTYIIVAAGLVINFVFAFIVNTIIRQFDSTIPNVTGMMAIIALFVLLLRAIELPFFYAFGSKIGAAIKGLLMVLVIFIAAVYFMFGDISWLGSQDDVMEAILKFLSDLSIRKLFKSVFGFILISSVPLYAISCYISTKLYLKGVDRYAK